MSSIVYVTMENYLTNNTVYLVANLEEKNIQGRQYKRVLSIILSSSRLLLLTTFDVFLMVSAKVVENIGRLMERICEKVYRGFNERF